jgi:hypothetical protein
MRLHAVSELRFDRPAAPAPTRTSQGRWRWHRVPSRAIIAHDPETYRAPENGATRCLNKWRWIPRRGFPSGYRKRGRKCSFA